MVLKKWILLSNKKIIENIWGLWLRDTDNAIIDGVGTPCKIGVMIKSSDNILDLVEENDMVGAFDIERKQNNIVYINKIHSAKGNILFLEKSEGYTNKIDTTENEKFKDFCIYKLQPNGDYKKYEVKQNEQR